MKIKKILLLFLISFANTILFGQGENDNWYFGVKAAVNFSAPAPVTLTNSQMTANESCGTASDANGNLLFYTDSKTIWNRQHQPMQNGTGLLGNSSAQQLIIVKNPANTNQYFVFITATADIALGTSNRISYSIVDMSLGPVVNGQPLGAVLPNVKNIAVTDNFGNNFGSEAITAITGAAANTYWVLIPKGNSLYSYKIDSSGFSNGNPVISNLNFPTTLYNGSFYSIKASPKLNNPNYSNLICISQWGEKNPITTDTEVRDINRVVSFNSTTGAINNFYSLTINAIMTYLPEFNQNGSVLFLGNQSIYAIDLLNSTTGSVNFMQIYNDPAANPYFSMQRNKYGNIYISKISSNFLGVINNSNAYGSNLSVTMNSVNLGTGSNVYGLPQLIPPSEEKAEGYYPCIDHLDLFFENNLLFYYQIGNTITTQTKYVLGPRHNITMQAGKSVLLLPGTDIQKGATYYAYIAPCRKQNLSKGEFNKNQTDMVLNLDKLDKEQRKTLDKEINIYPNPASTYVNIDSGNEKLISWEMYDMSGKAVLKGNSAPIDVQNLIKGNYLIKIILEKRQISKMIIVK